MAAILGPNQSPVFHDQMNSVISARLIQITIALAGCLGAVVLAFAWLVTRPAPPPYVFEANNKGEYIAQIRPVRGTESLPDALIQTDITQFIENAFTISSDKDEESDKLRKAHTMVANQAETDLRIWYFGADQKATENNPIEIGRTSWQEVQDISIIKEPTPNTYFARFTTIRHELNTGGTAAKQAWHMLMKIATVPNGTDEPRFYVTDLNFGKDEGK